VEMIDHWTLCWVLKLEDIQTACLTLSIIGLAMSILVFFWISMGYGVKKNDMLEKFRFDQKVTIEGGV
jgi:hypothetical protein